MSSAIPKVRMEAVHIMGVDDMSTQDVFGYFKEYPPAHIEWIDDTSCEHTPLSYPLLFLQCIFFPLK